MKARNIIKREWKYFARNDEVHFFRVRNTKVQYCYPNEGVWNNYSWENPLEGLALLGWKEVEEKLVEEKLKEHTKKAQNDNTRIFLRSIPSARRHHQILTSDTALTSDSIEPVRVYSGDSNSIIRDSDVTYSEQPIAYQATAYRTSFGNNSSAETENPLLE